MADGSVHGMNERTVLPRSTLVAFVTLFASACSSAGPSASTAEADTTPRVFVEAMVFDVPSGGLTAVGGADPNAMSFGDLAAQAGARYVVSPHVLATNDEITRMSRPTTFSKAPSAIDAAFASYRLDVKPHIIEPGRVRLGVDFDLADKQMKTTVEVEDKRVLFLPTEVTVEDRHLWLVVRTNIVRNDGDLRALFDERSAQRDTQLRSGAPNRNAP